MWMQKDPLKWINSVMKDGEELDDFLKTLKFTTDQVFNIFGVDPGAPEGDREIRVKVRNGKERGQAVFCDEIMDDEIEDLVLVNGVYQVRQS